MWRLVVSALLSVPFAIGGERLVDFHTPGLILAFLVYPVNRAGDGGWFPHVADRIVLAWALDTVFCFSLLYLALGWWIRWRKARRASV